MLKAAEALARACPADTALTPVRRMAILRVRLAAVRQATTAIHPALTRFYDALDPRAARTLRCAELTLSGPLSQTFGRFFRVRLNHLNPLIGGNILLGVSKREREAKKSERAGERH
jgi:hypothetical protein